MSERVSDEFVRQLGDFADGLMDGKRIDGADAAIFGAMVRVAVDELRERRAADLKPDEREALRVLCFLLGKHSHEPYAYDGEDCDVAIAVLSNLLAAEKDRTP